MFEAKKKWKNFTQEFHKLFIIWLVAIINLMAFRLYFIYEFRNQIKIETSSSDIFTALVKGFCFDSVIAGAFIVLPYLSLLMLSYFNLFNFIRYIRKFFTFLLFSINLFLCVVTITYFQEYNDQFNHFVFDGLYDDHVAVAITIYEQYNPITSIILFIAWLTLTLKLITFIERTWPAPLVFQSIKSPFYKVLFVCISFILVTVATRGSLESRPAMRKWADVTLDPFLNKTIITPLRSLNYALKDYKSLQSIDNENPFLESGSFDDTLIHDANFSIKSYMEKKTTGQFKENEKIPDHVFLIIMESYDSWPLQDKYAELNITNNLKQLAEKGLHFKNFLPAATGTMNSLASIASGLPFTGVNVSLIGANGNASAASIFNVFKDLGYETNFYYGGLASWQNVGNYIRNQDVDNFYSGANAGGKSSSGIWGIDDDQLFDLVLENTKTQRKSFSVILTTSYHGPFSLDVIDRGYHFSSNDEYPDSVKSLDDGSIDANVLGHLWFSDMALGDFVAQAEKQWPDTLFAITGDHYGRRYFNQNPNLYERSSVPFILYGDLIKPNSIDETIPATHIDIVPTIMEIIAPKDFIYHSFGNPIQLSNNKAIASTKDKFISSQSMWMLNGERSITIYENGQDTSISWPDFEQEISKFNYYKQYKKTMALAWHYIMKGEMIEEEDH